MLLPTRQIADPLVYFIPHPQGLEQRCDLGERVFPRPDQIQQIVPRPVLVEPANAHIVKYGKLRHQGVILVDKCSSLLLRIVELLEQGGLAGAALANEDDFLPAANLERDIPQYRLIFVGNADIF